MTRAALLPLLLALAACAREEAPPEVGAASFREAGALIGSTTRGGLSDLAGDWVIAQSYPGTPLAAPGTRLRIEPGSDGAARMRFDAAGGAQVLPVATAGPGRLRTVEGREFWVLWVDDDFRTAAVGTPDGTFGWIMDRPGAASADRTAAAREMLDFNGYDVGRLGGA